MPHPYQIIFAYAQLLERLEQDDDTPEEVLATAPVPSDPTDELLKRGPDPFTEKIVMWARQHADFKVKRRLIEIAARSNTSATRLPGGLGHGEPDDISDDGGEGHLGNAVEDSIQTIRRALGADDAPSPMNPQTDDS